MTTLIFKRGDTWVSRFYLYDDVAGARHLILAPLGEDLPVGTAVDVASIDARLHVRDRAGLLAHSCDLLDDLSLDDDTETGFIHWAANATDTSVIYPGLYFADLEVTIDSIVLSTDTIKIKVLPDITYA